MSEADDAANRLLNFSIRLCVAVKKEKCLYDRTSMYKNTPPEVEAAWEKVAKECNEAVEYCKYRWKSMYKSFVQSRRRNSQYYLHEHMTFLLNGDKRGESLNDETNCAYKYVVDEMDMINAVSDSDNQAASADELNDSFSSKNKRNLGVFIVDEFAEESNETEKEKHKRLSRKRACKRGLDPELINELADDGLEEKRPRKLSERPKTLSQLTEKVHSCSQKTDGNKVNANKSLNSREITSPKTIASATFFLSQTEDNKFEKPKMVDSFTCTEFQSHDSFTQYENQKDSLDYLDEVFLNSLKPQLWKMNGRQKMNFKRKIYQSIMEVFDDANDFPNSEESIEVPPKGAPLFVNTTSGELRLMRELASLVQAAKSTPEIIKATDKVVTTTKANKTPCKPKSSTSTEAAETRPNSKSSNILSSPSLDDEDDDIDFHLSNDNLEDEEDVRLPRSLEEIMAKPSDNKEPAKEDKVVGLPKRVLQKMVKVAGSNGSTIVARDGEKKRIYRIYPKNINLNNNRLVTNKNPSSVGTFYVAPSKSNTQVNPVLNKSSNSLPNISVKNFGNKTLNTVNTLPVSNANSNSTNVYNSGTNKKVNGPALYKAVHPANRILNATTGYFQTVPSTISTSQSLTLSNSNNKASQVSPQTTVAGGVGVGGSAIFTTTQKIIPLQNTMLPPSSNLVQASITKRPMQVRSHINAPQLIQRRFSICGPLPTEKLNNPSHSTKIISKTNSAPKSSVPQTQISKPISFNNEDIINQAPNKNTTSKTTNAKRNLEKTAQTPTNSTTENIKKVETNIKPDISSVSEEVLSKEPEEIPIIETAGTITADSLDPLYLKQTSIKSEPEDD